MPAHSVTLKSPAKVNLFLHVVGREVNGYHSLDSLVAFLPDLYDKLEATELASTALANEVSFVGPWSDDIPAESNTVKRALDLVSEHTAKRFRVVVTKNIPTGAGSGGGSSNAGTLLRYLIGKYVPALPATEIQRILISIGADVPSFWHAKAAYMRGLGEVLIPLTERLPGVTLLIIYPAKPISTPAVYKTGFANFRPLLQLPACFKTLNDLVAFLRSTTNDLYPNALKLLPELAELIAALKATPGCLLARMTGSGSACFGIFSDLNAAQAGLQTLQSEFLSYHCYLTGLT